MLQRISIVQKGASSLRNKRCFSVLSTTAPPTIRTRNTSIYAAPTATQEIRRYATQEHQKVDQQEEKGFFGKLIDQYSLKGQLKRSILSKQLFSAAQIRSTDHTWYKLGLIDTSFKSKHALLTMHIWFLHKRLILANNANRYENLDVQEQLFEHVWADTTYRIRSEKVPEMRVSKYVKQMQNTTFAHCMHYDHAFTFEQGERRREELCRAIWLHVFNMSLTVSDDLVNRLAMYVEFQYDNIVHQLPEGFWKEGRIEWGPFPNFDLILDNEGKLLVPKEIKEDVLLPQGWRVCLNMSGEKYYWNTQIDQVQWNIPQMR